MAHRCAVALTLELELPRVFLQSACDLGCLTVTGEPVPGPPDPVVGNARWRRRWDRLVSENKTRILHFFIAIYVQVYIYAALEAGHWHSPC
jgi:hypothetical protein